MTLSKLRNLFKDEALLTQALTHKSWVNEHPGQRETNERLEFLGDAILEFIVSYELYARFPNQEEGYLTALRANLVNTKNLSSVAQKLGVGEALFLSKGEEEGGGRTNPSLLADTMEAIIGALYLDQGANIAAAFVNESLLSELSKKVKEPLKDAKSRLQEYVQAKGLSAPRYQVSEESGPDHNKRFIITVSVGSKLWGRGEGKSKSQAEQEAANEALKKVYARSN